MLYPLVDRFQGGLFGSRLGIILSNADPCFTPACQVMNLVMSALIPTGNLSGLARQLNPFQENKLNISDLALASFPIALFSHESEHLLGDHLKEFLTFFTLKAEAWTDLLLWNYAIALALRQQLQPEQLISQLLNFADNYPHTPWYPQLQLVDQVCRNYQGMQTFLQQLSTTPYIPHTAMSLALYCFISTPDSFSLSLQRVGQTRQSVITAAALTGALSGVYNSYPAIPLNWRVYHQDDKIVSDSKQQAHDLFAVWSGIYYPQSFPWFSSTAVAAPNVLQSR